MVRILSNLEFYKHLKISPKSSCMNKHVKLYKTVRLFQSDKMVSNNKTSNIFY